MIILKVFSLLLIDFLFLYLNSNMIILKVEFHLLNGHLYIYLNSNMIILKEEERAFLNVAGTPFKFQYDNT